MDLRPRPESPAPVIERSRHLPRRTKLAFSAGSLEEAVVGAAGIATMLFYNQVLGLSGVVFHCQYLDGISDPIEDAFSDQFKSRWGHAVTPWRLSAAPIGSTVCITEGLSERDCPSGFCCS